MTTTPDQKQDLLILYDGECPFCTRYVQWVRLKDNLKPVLVNARENTPLRDEMTKAGYDLDHGMIVKYAGKTYYADEAVALLTLLSTPSNAFNRFTAFMFGSPRRTKFLYPFMAFCRRITVLLLGRGLIRNLRGK